MLAKIKKMKVKLIVLFAITLLLSCNSNKKDFKQVLLLENLFELESKTLNIKLMIPQKHHIFKNEDRLTIDLNPNGRAIRQFGIAKFQSNIKKEKYTESYTFENGFTLSYYTFSEAGGSGGTEYRMEGILESQEEVFKIVSIDQKELGKGEPEYCLKYLSTIKRIK